MSLKKQRERLDFAIAKANKNKILEGEKCDVLRSQIWAAERLERVGDVNGARIVLRNVAEALPNVELKTPGEKNV